MNKDIYIKLDLKYLLPHKNLILCYLKSKPYININAIIQNLNNLKEFCVRNLVEIHGSRFCQQTYHGYTTIIMDKEYVVTNQNNVQIKPEEMEFVKCSLIHELLHIASRGKQKSGLLVNYSNSDGLNEGITQLLAEAISEYQVEDSRNTYTISESCAKLLFVLCKEENILKTYFNHTSDFEQEVNRLSSDNRFFYYLNSELSTIINLYKYYFHYSNNISKDLENITPAREELAERLYHQKVKLFVKALTLFLMIPKLQEVPLEEAKHLQKQFSSIFASNPSFTKVMNDCIYAPDIHLKIEEFQKEKENLELQFSLLKEISDHPFVDYFVMENGISYLKYKGLFIKITSSKIEEEILSDSYFAKNKKETMKPFLDFLNRSDVTTKRIRILLDTDFQKQKEKLAAINQLAKRKGYSMDSSRTIYDSATHSVTTFFIPYQRIKKTLK